MKWKSGKWKTSLVIFFYKIRLITEQLSTHLHKGQSWACRVESGNVVFRVGTSEEMDHFYIVDPRLQIEITIKAESLCICK